MSHGGRRAAAQLLAGGGAFSPDDLADLALWLDASDAATFTYGTGTQVATWVDKSPNVFTVSRTASTACQRNTTVNGLGAVTFANAFLSRASVEVQSFVDSSARTNVMRFIVLTTHATNYAGFRVSADGATYRVSFDDRQPTFYWDAANVGSARLSGADAISDGATYLLSMYRNGGSMAYRVNTSDQVTATGKSGSVAASNTATLVVGNSQFQQYHGVLCEVISVAGYDATDFSDVEAYLKAKWGTP